MNRSIDPAALAAATLAAAVAVMMGDGPYNIWNVAIGVTLLGLLIGYDSLPIRSYRQSIAVTTVTAICLALALAYPLEVLLTANRPGAIRDGVFAAAQPQSSVPPWVMLSVWLFLLVPLFVLERWRVRRAMVAADANAEHVDIAKAFATNAIAATTDESSGFHRLLQPSDATELQRGWLVHAHKQRDRHDLSARYFDDRGHLLSSVAVALSAAVGTSVFVSLGKNASLAAQIAVGFLSVAAAVLTALNTNLNYGRRAEHHRAAAARFKGLIWRLEKGLATKDTEAANLSETHGMLQTLEQDSPVIPPNIYDVIEQKYKHVKYVPRPDELYP